MNDILPDVLRPNLDLIICGTTVGTESSRVGCYYAGQQNKFWSILKKPVLRRIEFDPRILVI